MNDLCIEVEACRRVALIFIMPILLMLAQPPALAHSHENDCLQYGNVTKFGIPSFLIPAKLKEEGVICVCVCFYILLAI